MNGFFFPALPEALKVSLREAAAVWEGSNKTSRLWSRDPTLWTNNGEENCLGWLDVVDHQLGSLSRLKALCAEIREDGFSHVVVLGTGASILTAEVFSLTFRKSLHAPKLLVLSSSDPAQIQSVREQIDPTRTLFCVASKYGTTLEPDLSLAYFYEESSKQLGKEAGNHFIAITDPGSKLEKVAGELGFRRVYHGVPSLNGAYSALSDFGLVPHAAMGLDTEKLLQHAKSMVAACRKPFPENPGVQLGLALAAAAEKLGRDKVTLLCSRSLSHLGAWLEQLLASSTGKIGKGLIPINGEPVADPADYGTDRVFAYLDYVKDDDAAQCEAINAIEKSGQPVFRIKVPELHDIGQIFFQWQIATAVAGSLMHINPFDQPDIEAREVATRELAGEFELGEPLQEPQPILAKDGMKLFADAPNAALLQKAGAQTIGDLLRTHFDRLSAGDYFALLAYLPPSHKHESGLEQIRQEIMKAKRVATVLDFGPRVLHSTAQTYLGGPNSGVFLQVTCQDAHDFLVPGRKYTFGAVKAAQALADFQALNKRHRRVLRVHVTKDVSKGLSQLSNIVSAAMAH
jgi:transaldolase/glucose-6-phosphate isomerase